MGRKLLGGVKRSVGGDEGYGKIPPITMVPVIVMSDDVVATSYPRPTALHPTLALDRTEKTKTKYDENFHDKIVRMVWFGSV